MRNLPARIVGENQVEPARPVGMGQAPYRQRHIGEAQVLPGGEQVQQVTGVASVVVVRLHGRINRVVVHLLHAYAVRLRLTGLAGWQPQAGGQQRDKRKRSATA
ncbi:hypothetical protein D9M71_689490 [compost metagenome]